MGRIEPYATMDGKVLDIPSIPDRSINPKKRYGIVKVEKR